MLHTRHAVHGAIHVSTFYCQIGTHVAGENAHRGNLAIMRSLEIVGDSKMKPSHPIIGHRFGVGG